MKHNISKLLHHVWSEASKVNVYSKDEISQGDTLSDGRSEVTVNKVCDVRHPNADNTKAKGVMFYELDIIKS